MSDSAPGGSDGNGDGASSLERSLIALQAAKAAQADFDAARNAAHDAASHEEALRERAKKAEEDALAAQAVADEAVRLAKERRVQADSRKRTASDAHQATVQREGDAQQHRARVERLLRDARRSIGAAETALGSSSSSPAPKAVQQSSKRPAGFVKEPVAKKAATGTIKPRPSPSFPDPTPSGSSTSHRPSGQKLNLIDRASMLPPPSSTTSTSSHATSTSGERLSPRPAAKSTPRPTATSITARPAPASREAASDETSTASRPAPAVTSSPTLSHSSKPNQSNFQLCCVRGPPVPAGEADGQRATPAADDYPVGLFEGPSEAGQADISLSALLNGFAPEEDRDDHNGQVVSIKREGTSAGIENGANFKREHALSRMGSGNINSGHVSAPSVKIPPSWGGPEETKAWNKAPAPRRGTRASDGRPSADTSTPTSTSFSYFTGDLTPGQLRHSASRAYTCSTCGAHATSHWLHPPRVVTVPDLDLIVSVKARPSSSASALPLAATASSSHPGSTALQRWDEGHRHAASQRQAETDADLRPILCKACYEQKRRRVMERARQQHCPLPHGAAAAVDQNGEVQRVERLVAPVPQVDEQRANDEAGDHDELDELAQKSEHDAIGNKDLDSSWQNGRSAKAKGERKRRALSISLGPPYSDTESSEEESVCSEWDPNKAQDGSSEYSA